MSDQYLTLGILLIAVLLFLSDKLRPDLISILTVVLLAATGVLTAAESFSGFGSSAVMIIISVFILAEGLRRTGVSEAFAERLLRWGGRREGALVTLFMGAGALLSLFINNIAAAAVLIPSAGAASSRSEVPISKLLIPLVFATIMGGMATLLTSMNILVSNIFEKHGLEGFGLLDFLPVGIPVLVAGIAYMVVWGRFRLPAKDKSSPDICFGGRGKLFNLYGMDELFFRARIPEGSYLDGRKLSDSLLREDFRLSLLGVMRHGERLPQLEPDTVLRKGDVLTLKGKASEFAEMDREPRLEILTDVCLTPSDVETFEMALVEVMLSPRSSLIGSTLREVSFRQRYGMNVIAIWREDQPVRRDVRNTKLVCGDALLGLVSIEKLPVLKQDPDLIVLTPTAGLEPMSRRRGPAAVAIVLATLVTVVLSGIPMSQVLFAGAMLMVLSGMLSMEQAYRAIDWRVIFLVAGMLPLALAISLSGLADSASSILFSCLGGMPPIASVTLLFLVSALLTQAVSGAAVAAIMAPIAVAAASGSVAPAPALGMAVALGSSMAFLTPLGHPVNMMVMGAGSYRFSDYRRVGAPLFVLLTIVILVAFSLRWHLL
ncbi:MAG: hypothetical protein AVO35_06235 [Candidatus Aegiribacteria sp. MLS_C]|nr:MAG: hypothetical protein AVO35_06235 [Candidatus Aegiribacteria sp. MLS_C]